jgi:hypothetical protein
MGDNFVFNSSQIGAAGQNANAQDMTLIQGNTIDLTRLAEELSMLRTRMNEKAVGPEQDTTTERVTDAEAAARRGDMAQVMESLAKAGKWALDVAKEISVNLAVKVIRDALHIPLA